MFSSRKQLRSHQPDLIFILLSFLLVSFGLIMLFSASSSLAKLKFDDSCFFIKKQILYGLIPGLIGFFIAYFFYYRKFLKISLLLLILGLISLLLVFTSLGLTINGARRWLNLGGFVFQPSEIARLFFIIYLASWLEKEERRKSLTSFLSFLFICGIFIFLIIKQPSTSMSILFLLTALILYLVSGGKISYFFSSITLFALIFLIVIISTPYRFTRIKAFLNPQIDPLGINYQTNQNLTALGSGGIFGKGFFHSSLKEKLIPEVITDSIFAVIGEEFGFLGSVIFITFFLLFVFRGFKIGLAAPDDFAKLLVIGLISSIALEFFINLAAVSSIIPFTGLPLPFVSKGGTSLATLLFSLGIIANISRYTRKNEK